MRRQVVYFADDILVEEITDMARAHGMHVRIRDGAVFVDRVPNFLRATEEHRNVVPLAVPSRRVKR